MKSSRPAPLSPARPLRIAAPIRSAASVLCALATAALTPAATATECSVPSLQGLEIPGVTIASATTVAADPPRQAYCDVRGSVVTDGEGAGPGSAGFTLMLPADWNGKYMFGGGRGTGGMLASSANAPDIEQVLVKGYAKVTTDSGHSNSDPDWYYTAPGVPDIPKLADYFYRATHQVTLATKALVKAYYGAATITRSYFDGCSNGGRQGAMEAVRYPDDYDGIVMGCPWLDPAGSALLNVKRVKAFLDPAAHIPLDTFAAIDAAVLESCDELDGVADGLIHNPAKCDFDPRSLVPRVLTEAQANALDDYLDAVRDEHGNLVSPGSSVSRLQAQFAGVRRLPDGSTLPGILMPEPAPFPDAASPWGDQRAPHIWGSAEGVIGRLGFNDPAFDLNHRLYDDSGVVRADALADVYRRLAPDIVADPARIRAFLDKGGKIIMYHGLSDVTITGWGSVLYYQALAEQNGGYAGIGDRVRLFMVPGMQHCNDGPDPVFFDTLTALERWVEDGVAPDSMLASYTRDWGKEVVRELPICPFPAKARHDGEGSVDDANSWSCPAGDRSMLELGRNGIQAGLNDGSRFGELFRGTPAATVER